MKKSLLIFLFAFFVNSTIFAQWTETEPNDDCSTANEIVYKGTYTGEFTFSSDWDYWYIDISGMPSGTISMTFNSDDGGAEGWQIQKVDASGCSTPVAYLPGTTIPPENNYHFFNETHSVSWTASENLVGLTIKAGGGFVLGDTYSLIINSGLPDPPGPVAETEPNDDCASSIANNQIQYLGTYSGQVEQAIDDDDNWYIDLTAIPSGTLSFAISTNDPDGVLYRFIKYDANGCAAPAGYQPPLNGTVDVHNISYNTPSDNFAWIAADNLVGLGIQIRTNSLFPVNYSFTISSGLPNPPAPQFPGGVAGANLWYKADEGVTQASGSISNWANQGSLTADAAQGTAANQPTLQTSGTAQINFNPAVRFDGSNDFLETPAFSTPFGTDGNGNLVASQFIVYRSLSATDGIVYSYDDLSYIYLGAHTLGRFNQGGIIRVDDNEPVALNEVALMDMVATTGSSVYIASLNKNGRENQTINTSTFVNGANRTFKIGKWFQGVNAHADIAEIVVYPALLSSNERKSVQSYLAIKYGISLGNNENTAIYYNSAATVIYASVTYKYDVFGIGKDDGSGLNQSQSNSANTGSGDGTGQSGKGNIVLSNPTSLDNGDFLIVGHDNGTLAEQSNGLPAIYSKFKRLNRTWKVKHTNDVGTVSLKFSTLGLTVSGTAANEFALLVDSDGDGDFTTGNPIVKLADSFAGDVVIYDNLTLADGVIFTIATLTGRTWTGTTNSDWAIATNWLEESLPTSTDNVFIPSGLTNYPVVGATTSASAKSVLLESGATLDIASGGSLIVTNALTLQSDASSSASFINKGTFTGTISYERYLDSDGTQWHLVSAPVTGQDFWTLATTTENEIAEKGGKRALTIYKEGIDNWDAYPSADPSITLSAGTGYSTLRNSNGIITFKGLLNNSDVNISIDSTKWGWNLVGNPYSSAINATTNANATDNLISANLSILSPNFAGLYIWDAASGQYVIINNAGGKPEGTLSQDYIQAGQGFFVRSKNGGGSFSFTKAMQSHQISVPLKSGPIQWPTIEINVVGNNKQSSTILAFNQNMTNGLDVTYDAGMFKADKNFALYSRLVEDNGVDFAIQALPEDYENLVIPIGLDVPAGTEVTFNASAMNLPADAAVWLEDRAAGKFTRLDSPDASYPVLISEKTMGVGNFFIHTKSSTTATDQLITSKAYQVVANHSEGFIRIITGEDNPGQAKLYDMAGRLHEVLNLEKGSGNKMLMNGHPGIYVIQISGGTQPYSEKIVWK